MEHLFAMLSKDRDSDRVFALNLISLFALIDDQASVQRHVL